MTDGPIKALYLCTGLQVDDAMAEQVQCLLTDIFGIVPVLKHGTVGQLVPNLRQVMYQLVVFCRGLEVLGHLRCRHTFHYIQNQHRVMRRKATATLGDEVGMRDIVLVCSLHKGVDTVIDILLNAIVDRAFRVAASCTVIVNTKTATTIDELDIVTHGMKLYIELCGLLQCCGYTAYLCYLATDVEVDECQTILQIHLLQSLQGS